MILVIDDDEVMRELMVTVLREEGYRVLACGPLAGMAQALREPPVALLIDIMMPEMDGPSIILELRAHETTKALPIIIVSGFHDAASWFARLKAAAILGKPFEIAQLIRVVRQVAGPPPTQKEET